MTTKQAHELSPFLPTAAADDQKVAVWRDRERLDYGTLAARVELLASELSVIPEGSAVGIRIGNEPAFLVSFLACLRAGRAAVVLDPFWTELEWRYATNQVEMSLILCSDEARHSGSSTCVLDPLGRIVSWPSAVGHSSRFAYQDIAVIHWSSGSTGRPKPIGVSRRALAFRVASLVEAFSLTAADRMLCFVPLSHCHGLDCISLPIIAARGELVLLDPRSATPERVVDEVAARDITVFSAFPRFYELLLSAKADSDSLGPVRLPLCGSAALSPSVARAFAMRFGNRIRNGYGLTEVGLLAMNKHEHAPERFDSVGRMLPGIEWRIDDPSADGVGELWVRSPGCADSYLGGAEDGRRLKEGWLRTQDLVRSDEEGYLYIVGRMSRFINVDGAKVDPDEIERTIEALPWVAECAVTGAIDDAAERIVAFVVPRSPAGVEQPEESVRRHVAEHLSLYKVPAQVKTLAALPRNTLGKVLYSQLPIPSAGPRRAGDSDAADGRSASRARTSAQRMVADIWCAVLGLERVGVHDNFTDVGGTSLHLAQLRLRLRERFGRELTIVDLFRYPTVDAQARFLGGPAPAGTVASPSERARKRREKPAPRESRRQD